MNDFTVEESFTDQGERELTVTLSPKFLAEAFCNLDSEKQAEFFNHCGEIGSKWPQGCWPMQLQYITEEKGLTYAGRRMMDSIGEYSHWGLSCNLAAEVREEQEKR